MIVKGNGEGEYERECKMREDGCVGCAEELGVQYSGSTTENNMLIEVRQQCKPSSGCC